MATIDPHIFRAYDIRGVVGKNVTEELCHLVGKGFGTELRERYKKENPTVIVGRDARTHGPKLEKALIDGLISTGCHVKTIGQTPTPTNYFALCHFEADGSVQVTASHNAKEDNGLKLQIRDAEAFSGEELQGLMRRIEEERFEEGKGSVEEIDAITPYREKVLTIAPLSSRAEPRDGTLKVAVDFGNGVSGPVYAKVLEDAGAEVIPLFAEPDGTFPNHIADPTKHETLKDLQETVRRERANCGIAFDGDGDRVGFVDEKGTIMSADKLLLLLAEDHLQRNPGAAIIYTVSMSSILESEVKKMGGKPVMCIVGHSFVEHAMRENGSHLGGEQSGHFFCGEDFYDHDDALVAALRILAIFSATNNQKPVTSNPLTFSKLFEHFPKTFQTPEWRPHCPDEKKTEIVQNITKHFQNDYHCITIDGVRIDFGDGAWAGIRQSNTSPKLSICMEAQSKEKLQEVEGIIREHLKTYEEIEG